MSELIGTFRDGDAGAFNPMKESDAI